MKTPIHNGHGDKDDRDDVFGTLMSEAYPNLLLRNMRKLELTSAEFTLVSYLISSGFSWDGTCIVAASLKEMHRATGLATGTIHNAKDGLVSKGLIQILNTRNKERTNTYNLLPLREKLAEFAEWRLPITPEPKADEGDPSRQPDGQ